VVILSDIILSIVVLNVVMLSVIMLAFVAKKIVQEREFWGAGSNNSKLGCLGYMPSMSTATCRADISAEGPVS
jgi:hypothetical protein